MSAASIATLTSLALLLGACQRELPPSAFAGSGPEMRPETFFAGSTASSGVLEDRSGAPTRRFHVEGTGEVVPDGSFRLQQRVRFDHAAPETRTWVLRRLDVHRYVGTLTDAAGPVTAEAYGDLFHLRYSMKSPAGGRMEQWLYLQPDGRTVLNEATVSWFGVVLAHLSERITSEGH
jgi:hypothetical protein